MGSNKHARGAVGAVTAGLVLGDVGGMTSPSSMRGEHPGYAVSLREQIPQLMKEHVSPGRAPAGGRAGR